MLPLSTAAKVQFGTTLQFSQPVPRPKLTTNSLPTSATFPVRHVDPSRSDPPRRKAERTKYSDLNGPEPLDLNVRQAPARSPQHS
ncbi:MAG: hypothetical protein CMM01_00660 [Rhodopirellula sp.]|nr:hypothetical protein [Rhodopirellula sp.]